MGWSKQTPTVSATLNAAATLDISGCRGARIITFIARGTGGNLSAFALQRKDIANSANFVAVTDATTSGDTIAGAALVAAGLSTSFAWPAGGCPHNRLRFAITGASCVALAIDVLTEKQTQELDATQFLDS